MRTAILIATIIAMTLVAVWAAGAPVKSNGCWALPQYGEINMTSTEFEQQYADNSGVTVEWLRAQDRVVVKCECEYHGCQGWASLTRDQADHYMTNMPGLYGYRYPLDGE